MELGEQSIFRHWLTWYGTGRTVYFPALAHMVWNWANSLFSGIGSHGMELGEQSILGFAHIHCIVSPLIYCLSTGSNIQGLQDFPHKLLLMETSSFNCLVLLPVAQLMSCISSSF